LLEDNNSMARLLERFELHEVTTSKSPQALLCQRGYRNGEQIWPSCIPPYTHTLGEKEMID
jgi:hypothetical protein